MKLQNLLKDLSKSLNPKTLSHEHIIIVLTVFYMIYVFCVDMLPLVLEDLVQNFVFKLVLLCVIVFFALKRTQLGYAVAVLLFLAFVITMNKIYQTEGFEINDEDKEKDEEVIDHVMDQSDGYKENDSPVNKAFDNKSVPRGFDGDMSVQKEW